MNQGFCTKYNGTKEYYYLLTRQRKNIGIFYLCTSYYNALISNNVLIKRKCIFINYIYGVWIIKFFLKGKLIFFTIKFNCFHLLNVPYIKLNEYHVYIDLKCNVIDFY